VSNFKQINYIKTMLSQAKRSTRQEFEDTGILLNKETPHKTVNHWINKLESELGFIKSDRR
jgi:hypothetical protein